MTNYTAIRRAIMLAREDTKRIHAAAVKHAEGDYGNWEYFKDIYLMSYWEGFMAPLAFTAAGMAWRRSLGKVPQANKLRIGDVVEDRLGNRGTIARIVSNWIRTVEHPHPDKPGSLLWSNRHVASLKKVSE